MWTVRARPQAHLLRQSSPEWERSPRCFAPSRRSVKASRLGCWSRSSLERGVCCEYAPRRACRGVARASLSELPVVAEAERSAGAGDVLFKETLVVKRVQKVEGKVTVRLDPGDENGGGKGKLVVGCDLEGKWVLHWGVSYCDDLGSEWDQPPTEMRPPGSVPVKDYAIETPLRKAPSSSSGNILHEVQIDLNHSSSLAAIHFVLKDEESGSWYQNRGRNFRIPISDYTQENGVSLGGSKHISIWAGSFSPITDLLIEPEGADRNDEINAAKIGTDKKKHRLVENFYEEYSILKQDLVENYVTVSVIRSADSTNTHILFDTDIPGKVIVHWGVCRDSSKKWEIPKTSFPPDSKVFRKKALQTSLQEKTNAVGSWGSFLLEEDIVGVLFVLKIDGSAWLDDMGNDFYVPLISESTVETVLDQSKMQDMINGKEMDALSSAGTEILETASEEAEKHMLEVPKNYQEEKQDVESSECSNEIINDIRNLVTDISSEKSMITTSKEAQASILQEIEKLAAEAYSIFRSSTQAFVEDLVSDVESMKPPIQITSGTGTGYEILCQGFNWESHRSGRWYADLSEKATELANFGFTTIWLPPPTESVSPEGYMPKDLYNLNSRYGSVEELKNLISRLHEVDINVLGDVVLNHRCAHYQNRNGVWNIFGGRLNWDDRAVVSDDPHFQGRGNKSSGDNFHAAPNIDHCQEFVRNDLKEWLYWLRREIGYDGWRLDFVRGFWGGYVKDYMESSGPYFAVGEYWDSLSYTYGQMDHNQDAHRQRIVDWINATNGTSGAFDVTTKGILHTALGQCEYWRLSDERGKPPGVVGWWPSRAVTFIENHDTGSTQGHWRFPCGKEMQGYAYILTHPGTPSVFYDHIFSHFQQEIANLISLRRRSNIHCRSAVKIMKAERDVYAAEIDEKLIMKIGPGYYEPSSGHSRWMLAAEGRDYKVWESA